ncbi:hypothetical protein Bbelb_164570 [Branchiostoma belcheri]|nr:hypothetical protein Bbelb_164570 [Branchiostoma belcheri]
MPPDPPARYPATPTRPLTAAMPPNTQDRRSVSGRTDDAVASCHYLCSNLPCSCEPSLHHATLPKSVKTVPCRRLPAEADRCHVAASRPLTARGTQPADSREPSCRRRPTPS